MVNEQQKQMLSMLAHGLSMPPRTPIMRTPKDYNMEFEEVTFETADGVPIKGWFIPADSSKVIISNHFSPANRYGFAGHLEGLDFAGGFEVNFLPRYKALHDAGYNILAYDLRKIFTEYISYQGMTVFRKEMPLGRRLKHVLYQAFKNPALVFCHPFVRSPYSLKLIPLGIIDLPRCIHITKAVDDNAAKTGFIHRFGVIGDYQVIDFPVAIDESQC